MTLNQLIMRIRKKHCQCEVKKVTFSTTRHELAMVLECEWCHKKTIEYIELRDL